MSTSKRFTWQTLDEMTGLIDNAGIGSQVGQVDLADPARPREVAISDPLPGQVADIRPAGSLLVVAAEGGPEPPLRHHEQGPTILAAQHAGHGRPRWGSCLVRCPSRRGRR